MRHRLGLLRAQVGEEDVLERGDRIRRSSASSGSSPARIAAITAATLHRITMPPIEKLRSSSGASCAAIIQATHSSRVPSAGGGSSSNMTIARTSSEVNRVLVPKWYDTVWGATPARSAIVAIEVAW